MEIRKFVEILQGHDIQSLAPEQVKHMIDEIFVLDLPMIVEEKDNPKPMDNLGALVDKLVTVGQKMWWNQEDLYEIRRMTSEEFAEKWGDRPEELHALIQRACTLNVQRANLMDEIDTYLKDVVTGKIREDQLSFEQHKTY